ncbi:MAG: dTDP-4-dehydrorhamnose reductase [Acetobacteraceae bacterium]
MTILVTGGAGQLATALEGRGGRLIRRVGRPEFDFDRPETVEAAFRAAAPSLVVNAAAYTAVDAAETDAEAAYRANRDGPALLARLCAEAGVPLIHVSTDYVFDGLKSAPYVEDDRTSPTGVYGASKLAGEQAVLESGARAIVLRTSWVYASTGKNFVRTMLGAAQRMRRLRVVADQKGCPTNAADLAAAILTIAARLGAQGWDDKFAGVFHAAGSGWTTWHGLACAVFEEAAKHGMTPPEVEAITTADWPTPARRPPDSRLDCSKLGPVFGVRLPEWRGSLGAAVGMVLAGANARAAGVLPGG